MSSHPHGPDDVAAGLHAKTRRAVEDHGWTGYYTKMPDQPAYYAYTVGFTRSFEFPEAVVTGLDLDTSNAVLAALGAQLASGERPAFHVAIDLDLTFPVVLQPVLATARPLLVLAEGFYGADPYEAIQVVWPDRHGRFPWEAGHRQAGSYQPLLCAAPPN
jgi:hypothetical protein